jgi:uncharacterized protein involved in outer membrane biogenesis
VPKIAKRFLFVVAAIAAVIALVLLCINLYLQSGGVQQRIRAAAERALGSEVKIRSTSYTPWGGLNLRGLSIPDPTAPQRNIVEADGLRVRFPLMPLFQQRFVVTECILIEPTLIARQTPDGNWVLPFGRRPKEVAPPAEPAGPSVKGPSFKAELQRVRLAEGTIVFIDSNSRPVLSLDKVDIVARVNDGRTAEGTFYIARMQVSNSLKPNKIGGPFTWDGSVLDLPDIKGFLAGGNLTGSYRLLASGEPSFALNAQLDGVLLKKLVEDANVEPGKTDGKLQGAVELSGDPRNSDSLTGKGNFELIQATLRPVEILVQVGQLLQIEELQLLRLHDARTNFTVGNERVSIDDLILKSENVIITATGPIRFNGKLNLDARLLVSNKLQRQLGGLLGNNFVESDIPDYRQMPFTVTGEVDNPKIDLLDRITGMKLGNEVPGLLKSLFQAIPPQKKKNSKKKDGNK